MTTESKNIVKNMMADIEKWSESRIRTRKSLLIDDWFGCYADKDEIKSGTISKIYKLDTINKIEVVKVYEFTCSCKNNVPDFNYSSYSKKYFLSDIIKKEDFKEIDKLATSVDMYIDNFWSDRNYVILSEKNYVQRCQNILKKIIDICEKDLNTKCLLEDGTLVPSASSKLASKIYDTIYWYKI